MLTSDKQSILRHAIRNLESMAAAYGNNTDDNTVVEWIRLANLAKTELRDSECQEHQRRKKAYYKYR